MPTEQPRKPKVPAALDGVPETTLWTLQQRAKEAGRAGSPLRDPRALELVEALDVDFAARFGRAPARIGQYIGLRALTFDREVATVLATHPDAVVVALGEGLETQFWRLDNGRVRWFTVELPQTAALRARLLGEDPPRRRQFAGSATEPAWFDTLGATVADRVVVVAQGLLMYLRPTEVRALIDRCARTFRGGVMLFDTVPPWLAAAARSGRMRGPGGYAAPPMPWGVKPPRLVRDLSGHPSVASARIVDLAPADRLSAAGLRAVRLAPGASRIMPGVVRLDFVG